MSQCIRPALAWIDGAFRRGYEIEIDGDCIAAVRQTDADATHPQEAMIPGFVNAHSHAFQRGLRGLGEVFTTPEDDFWSWRSSMYELVDSLTPDSAYEHSLRAFGEMRAAGMTSVGEFHYIHHSDMGMDWALDDAVCSAANDAGIRLVLLHACYLAGGFGQTLSGAQCRFDGGDMATWWKAVDRAQSACQGSLQSVGVVIHSLRAVPIDVASSICEEARRRGLVIHLHLEEQPAEIEACLAAHGCTPMRLVLKHLSPGEDMTAVHCTHTTDTDMADYAAAGGGVCLCPLTEANLGDGIADVVGMRASGASMCLGSDSNARISMLEEMRLCEYGQRLRDGRRGACVNACGRIDVPLIDMATRGGAAALGLDAGNIVVGALADFTCIDLEAAPLANTTDQTLSAALITGGDVRCIGATIIGGRRDEPRDI